MIFCEKNKDLPDSNFNKMRMCFICQFTAYGKSFLKQIFNTDRDAPGGLNDNNFLGLSV